MITRLINFIGNKKVITGTIFVIVIFVIGYNIFFFTTKKEFDTDGDGKIDKVEYYRRGVKIKEVVYFDKVSPESISYTYWNKNGGIDKIVHLYSNFKFPLTKAVDKYNKGVNVYKLGKSLIKQELVEVISFDKRGKVLETKVRGRYYMYSKDRKISFIELDEENKGRINKIILFDINGITAQTKEDKDSNGKFEYYEFYEHGKKTAVGYDYDEDGEIDKKEEVKDKHKE